MAFDLNDYSSTIRSILEPAEKGLRLMPLAPDGPSRNEGWEQLKISSTQELFHGPPASPDFASCVESALYLYFSDLDQSHAISQGIGSTTGSLLHGIMHRQEPDFSNAKYWFRKAGSHPVFSSLRKEALETLGRNDPSGLGEAISQRDAWDAFWMVDQCEAARTSGGSDLERSLLQVQRVEWQLVFDYCYRHAVVAS